MASFKDMLGMAAEAAKAQLGDKDKILETVKDNAPKVIDALKDKAPGVLKAVEDKAPGVIEGALNLLG